MHANPWPVYIIPLLHHLAARQQLRQKLYHQHRSRDYSHLSLGFHVSSVRVSEVAPPAPCPIRCQLHHPGGAPHHPPCRHLSAGCTRSRGRLGGGVKMCEAWTCMCEKVALCAVRAGLTGVRDSACCGKHTLSDDDVLWAVVAAKDAAKCERCANCAA